MPFKGYTSISQGDEEIILLFNYPAAGRFYINAIYNEGLVFLPVSEVFSLLSVHYEQGKSQHSLKGTWLNTGNTWEIDVNSLKAIKDGKTIFFSPEDFRIGNMDIFLSPCLFKNIFGLQFTFNMSALLITLKSDDPLPVDQQQRRKLRHFTLGHQQEGEQFYPMIYPRDRKLLGGGMVDYNLGIFSGNRCPSFNYNLTGGMEFMGGDFSGAVTGRVADADHSLRPYSLNWRYVLDNNPFLTSFQAGQIITTGLRRERILGISAGNEPVVPRQVHSNHVIEGSTIPCSEIELYVNDRLIDFRNSDESGYYRFEFPLTYGTVRISVRIYKPTGEVSIRSKQLKVPYTILSEGIVAYNLQAGYVEDGISIPGFGNYIFHGDAAWGFHSNMTAKIGADYRSIESLPIFYGTLSAIYDRYLLNIDIIPGRYYRAGGDVTYASGKNAKFAFTLFDRDPVYNPWQAERELFAGLYLPYKFSDISTGIRLNCKHSLYGDRTDTNCKASYNIRNRRMTMRFDYRGWFLKGYKSSASRNELLAAAATYAFPAIPAAPQIIRGVFARAYTQWNLINRKIRSAGMQLSLNLFKNSRFSMNIDYDFPLNNMYWHAGFSINLSSVRLTTQYSHTHNNHLLKQNIYGSLGFDSGRGRLIPSNRARVGHAGVSVLMYIDTNENGSYDDGEEVVPSNAIRLDQAAKMKLGEDGILRISGLINYRKYNAELVQTALPNPMLAPLNYRFSFIADPNRYKRIEIPLYSTGVIEGKIIICRGDEEQCFGGLRLIIKGMDNNYQKKLKSFSDGTFYCMGILPGRYSLEVDPVQLGFLNVVSRPRRIEFEVKALVEGDFLDELDFFLFPAVQQN